MNKQNFLKELEVELIDKEVGNRETYLNYYEEILNDYIEDSYTEEEAVLKIGSIEEIIQIIIEENKMGGSKHTKKMSPLVLALLIIGSPLWLSILISIFLLVFSILLILWCVPFTLGALSFAGILTGAVSLMGLGFNSDLYYIVTQLGVALIAFGVGLLLLLATTSIMHFIRKGSKMCLQAINKFILFGGELRNGKF